MLVALTSSAAATGGLLAANNLSDLANKQTAVDNLTNDAAVLHVKLASTATEGLQLYNTVDQTTNYERLETLWSGNQLVMRTVKGGTGTLRPIVIGPDGTSRNFIQLNNNSTDPFISLNFSAGGIAAGNTYFSVANAQANGATSGTVKFVSITPTYNQSASTAANTDLLINRTQTAVGSGTQLLIDAQVGGTSMFSVNNSGTVTMTAPVTNLKQVYSTGGSNQDISWYNGASEGAHIRYTEAGGGSFEISSIRGGTPNIVFKPNSTTALTLDSSQNATFAGNVLRFAAGKGLQGSATNDAAAAGYVGELLSTTVASGSAVSLTTATSTNMATLSLTAGDWDVTATFIYIPGATTSITQLSQGISQSTGALPTTTTGAGDYTVFSTAATVPGANNISQVIEQFRVSLSGTTNIFAVARPTFTVSTLSVYGIIRARRIR